MPEHDTKTYFEENESGEVAGFVIIGTTDDEYHIAEKWSRAGKSDKWVQYWLPAERLATRVEEGKCEPTAKITDEQFRKVCDKFDHSGITPGKGTA